MLSGWSIRTFFSEVFKEDVDNFLFLLILLEFVFGLGFDYFCFLFLLDDVLFLNNTFQHTPPIDFYRGGLTGGGCFGCR